MADMDASVSAGPEPMNVGSQLCTQCGLCCTGALHDTATAEADEVETLRGRGLDVITVAEGLRFRLPCPCLKGTSCGIYEERPRVCSRYRCRLLQEVESATVALDEATLKVRTARQLFENVKSLMPAGMTVPQARAMCRGDQVSAVDPHLRLQLMALMRYLDLHFRHSEEGPVLHEEVLAMRDPKGIKEESHQHV
jgi:Fe-S-cluster containining protein